MLHLDFIAEKAEQAQVFGFGAICRSISGAPIALSC